MVQPSAQFRNWLKQATNMKLATASAITRVSHEGITDLQSLADFNKDSLEMLPRTCNSAIEAVLADPDNGIEAEPAVPKANVSIASVHRLIVASNAVRFYRDVGRTPTFVNMHYNNVLADFKVDYDAYQTLKKQDSPETPLVNDKDRDKKIIKWVPLFEDAMSRSFGAKGPLRYIIRENAAVMSEADDPLEDNSYFGTSGSLLEELVARLPHNGPTFRDDNKTLYMAISKAVAGTSVESTIKSFSRAKNGRGAYFALISNHAGDTKYRSIVKSRMNLLTNVKWNGRSYPFETHVSNHRQANDDLVDCASHIDNQVPNESQRVEYLLDSISCQDSALQAAIGNIRADSAGLRTKFEEAAAHMMEVDPYKRTARSNTSLHGREAQISDARFTAGRGTTGVDFRWYPRKEFLDLTPEQRDELTNWQKSTEGKKAMRNDNKKRKSGGNGFKNDNDKSKGRSDGSWKKKMKKALKTADGLAHVMSILAAEETSNAALVASLSQAPALPPAPSATPPINPQVASVNTKFNNLATKVQLQSILKSANK